MSPEPENITQNVQIDALRFTPAMVGVVIVLVVGWMATFFSIRNEIGSKASMTSVEELHAQVKTNTRVLGIVEARQLRMYCDKFPQSFECPASTRGIQ